MGNFNFEGEEWGEISYEAQDLIRRMLAMDTTKRYSAQECLQHEWILKNQKKSKASEKQMTNCLRNLKSFRVKRFKY